MFAKLYTKVVERVGNKRQSYWVTRDLAGDARKGECIRLAFTVLYREGGDWRNAMSRVLVGSEKEHMDWISKLQSDPQARVICGRVVGTEEEE